MAHRFGEYAPGLMMEQPLLISSIAKRAEALYGARQVCARTLTGIESITYGDLMKRVRRLASALIGMGIGPGDRVASLGWNSLRHLELYFAVPAIGAVLHTLNIRLSQDDLTYIITDAADKIVFVDASLAELVPEAPCVERIIVMPDGTATDPGLCQYEDLIEAGSPNFDFPQFKESAAAIMCYTSGTTGRPKGVVYSHRSICLFSLLANQPDGFGIREDDTVMPIVPMFHANAWGLPYVAAMTGAGLVMPGPAPTPKILAEMIATFQVTVAAAVPTVWQGIAGLCPRADLYPLREAVAGGAAVPESLIRTFDDAFGVTIVQGWGMTETSPTASLSRVGEALASDTRSDASYRLRAMQGRLLPFLEARLDETAGGELQLRGPTVVRQYYNGTGSAAFTDDGWLRTGDIAEINSAGFIKIVDRTKDLIKSGGEWISSVDLETAALFHDDIDAAAVVARPDPKWGERPCMFVVTRPESMLSESDVQTFLRDRFASWWIPDHVLFVDEIPMTSVGKIDKKRLRGQLAAPRAETRS